MAFEIRTGPRGPEPLWNGRLLVSSYNPSREAETWAESRVWPPGSLVFVAGDPLGGACQALKNRGVQAIALLPGAAVRPYLPEDLVSWAPEDGPLEGFLDEVFSTTGPDGVVWEVWPSYERQASAVVLDWSRRFRDVFRTVQGSWLTNRRFGPRFWRNACRNALDWEQPARLEPGTRPIVVAASGPSLDEGLVRLARHRGRFDLWALPSSFEPLVRRGLIPDAGIATDGGFYAREHLQRLAGTSVPVLAALSSAADPTLTERPCGFFSQGLTIERTLLGAWMTAFPEIPSQGTVASTALRLALEATTGPVLIAGLDLAFQDLRGHASPHTVDRRFQTLHDRLTPQEGLWASRLFDQATMVQSGVRTSPALVTYAGWFRTRARFSRPVFRIAPTAIRWDSMTELSWEAAEQLLSQAEGRRAVQWTSPSGWPPRIRRRELMRTALGQLAERVNTAAPDAAWLVEAARSAVPEALAEDFAAQRWGKPSSRARQDLGDFLAVLREELD